MKINCSRPFNNTKKNDSYIDYFEPDDNFDQAMPFRIAFYVLNAFLSFTALLGNCAILITIWKTSSLHSAANILLTSLAVSDLAVGLLVQPFYIAVMQSGIPTVVLFFNILVYFFCCASFITITAITIDRMLVLQFHLRYRAVVTTFRDWGRHFYLGVLRREHASDDFIPEISHCFTRYGYQPSCWKLRCLFQNSRHCSTPSKTDSTSTTTTATGEQWKHC